MPTLPRLAVLLVISLAVSASAADAQESKRVVGQAAATTQAYRLGPGDLLSVTVVGVGKSNGRVSNSGKIHVPHLGILRVTDMTVAQVEAAIADGLREKGLVNEPWVQVDLVQRRARPVYLLGEVMMPGQFLINDEMYLTDLITLGGGFNEFATPVGFLYRRSPAQPGKPADGNSPEWSDEVIQVDFEKVLGGEDTAGNLKLQGGDVLYVPQRRTLYFFVVGEVVKPGAFEYPQKGANSPKTDGIVSGGAAGALSQTPLTVAQAVARAGGPLRTAKAGKSIVVRFAADGSRREMPVDLGKVYQGRQADFTILPGDIVYVPGSGAKGLAYSFLRILPGVAGGSLVFR